MSTPSDTPEPRDYRLSFGEHVVDGVHVPELDMKAPELQHIEFAVERPWLERLFSRPWKPQHNVTVTRCLATMEVSESDPMAWDIRPVGKARQFTARRHHA